MRTRSLRSLVYFGGGVGVIVSIFAALEFYDASLRTLCSVNSYLSCGTVDTSGLTNLLDIPDYLWGIGGFVLILLLAALAEQLPRDRRRAYALLGVTTFGVAIALYFLYVELALIHALCPVCVGAYLMGGIAWVGAIGLVRRVPGAESKDDEDDDMSNEEG
jgi:uncharacterized membrane protein